MRHVELTPELLRWLEDGRRLLAEFEAATPRPEREIARLERLMGNANFRLSERDQWALVRAGLWWP